MEIIIHRVNTVQGLKDVPQEYGTEIDIRALGKDLILNHEPFHNGDRLVDYLDNYQHGTLILNVKEAGIEDRVLEMVRSYSQIESYLYRASRQGERAIAVRYSEDESIDTAKKYEHLVDWIWIDTNTKLPIDDENKETLQKFSTCLVCPERWGRPQDIEPYRQIIGDTGFQLDAVMTSMQCAKFWA